MSTLAEALVVLAAVIFGATYADETTTANYRQERQSDFDPDIYGIASVAGVTSRNGRLSTTGGIYFHPAEGAIATSGDGFYNPLTFSKATNGKFASGSVQIQPGALGVSSTAQVGYVTPDNAWQNQWPVQNNRWQEPNNQWQEQNNQWPVPGNQWPVQSQFYAPFEQRVPWFNKVKFEVPQTRDMRRWLYPSFNPFFNYWR